MYWHIVHPANQWHPVSPTLPPTTYPTFFFFEKFSVFFWQQCCGKSASAHGGGTTRRGGWARVRAAADTANLRRGGGEFRGDKAPLARIHSAQFPAHEHKLQSQYSSFFYFSLSSLLLVAVHPAQLSEVQSLAIWHPSLRVLLYPSQHYFCTIQVNFPSVFLLNSTTLSIFFLLPIPEPWVVSSYTQSLAQSQCASHTGYSHSVPHTPHTCTGTVMHPWQSLASIHWECLSECLHTAIKTWASGAVACRSCSSACLQILIFHPSLPSSLCSAGICRCSQTLPDPPQLQTGPAPSSDRQADFAVARGRSVFR